MNMKDVAGWVRANWMYAGLVAALFLIALAPVVAQGAGAAFFLVYLQLPAYMLHQVEEHAGDRFRRFVNETIGGGKNVLTTEAVLVINIPCVWGIYLADIYCVRFVAAGLGLIGTYAMLINAVTHLAAAGVKRCTNPGVWSAAFLFLPLGLASFVAIVREGATWSDHVIGLAIAVCLHIAIVAHVKRAAATAPVFTPRSHDAIA